MDLVFSLVVINSIGVSSAPDAVNVGIAVPPSPIANAGSDQTVSSGTVVQLNGTGSSDPSGLPLTYRWTQTSGPAVTIGSPTAALPTFAAPLSANGVDLVFSLVVNNSVGSASLPDTVTVRVSAVSVPIANAGADQDVVGGSLVTLDGTGSSDPSGLPLTYSWIQIGSAVTLSNTTAVSPTFTAPLTANGVNLVFRLVVTNSLGVSSAPDTVTISIDAVSVPIANAGADQTVASGSSVTLNGTGSSDPSGLPLTYRWTQSSGPPVTLSNPALATISFTAPASETVQNIIFELVVTNTIGVSSDIDNVVITVNSSSTLPPSIPDCTASLTGNKIISGTVNSDTIVGTSGNNLINGLGGNDAINGCSGIDNIFGNDGNDTIAGDSQDDRISGNDGNDTIAGGLGNDVLYGGNGNDAIAGDSGNDILYGEGGTNTLTGGLGKDKFFCGTSGDNITDFTPGKDTKSGNCVLSSSVTGGYNYGPSLILSGTK
jgi:Ca2+-binding RTX toxin-like protein